MSHSIAVKHCLLAATVLMFGTWAGSVLAQGTTASVSKPGDVAPTAPAQVEKAPAREPGAPVSARPAPLSNEQSSVPVPQPAIGQFPPKEVDWAFEGPFGVYDRAALQRGFGVYKEICSSCHALKYVAFRNLSEPGGPEFPVQMMQAIAASFRVPAGPDETGQMMARPGTPADYFPPPFPNEQATRAANNGALPPDLSLIVKAREGNQNYVYSILMGYGLQQPATEVMAEGLYYNPYFPRHQIAMPPPLRDGAVTFADGTPATVGQLAGDVVTFLSWASEPKMEERKRTGFGVMLYLLAFSTLLFLSYRRVWHGHHDAGATRPGRDA